MCRMPNNLHMYAIASLFRSTLDVRACVFQRVCVWERESERCLLASAHTFSSAGNCFKIYNSHIRNMFRGNMRFGAILIKIFSVQSISISHTSKHTQCGSVHCEHIRRRTKSICKSTECRTLPAFGTPIWLDLSIFMQNPPRLEIEILIKKYKKCARITSKNTRQIIRNNQCIL